MSMSIGVQCLPDGIFPGLSSMRIRGHDLLHIKIDNLLERDTIYFWK